MDASGRVCLVTGANSGIGRATALGLARHGAHVVLVCRDQGRGAAARTQIIRSSGSETVDVLIADLESQRDIRQLAQAVRAQYPRLHVLVNNAGAMFSRRTLTEDGIERTFALNHLAYFLLSNLLLDHLAASAPARIVNVASGAAFGGMLNFDDLTGAQHYDRRQAYNQSKLANVLFTFELARRAPDGVTVNCLNPGTVRTNLGGVGRRVWLLAKRVLSPGRANTRSVEAAARDVIALALDPAAAAVSGAYFEDGQPQDAPPQAADRTLAQRLWTVSADLTGFAG